MVRRDGKGELQKEVDVGRVMHNGNLASGLAQRIEKVRGPNG
jgi:hypothetical protein